MIRDTESPRSGLLGLYQRYSRLSLGVRILIFMILGIAAGILFGERALVVEPLGDLFIRLLMMAAIPLVFFNLVAGLTSLSDIGVLGTTWADEFSFTTPSRPPPPSLWDSS